MSALWNNSAWRAGMKASSKERTSAGGKANIAAGGGFGKMSVERLLKIAQENGKKAIPRLISNENLVKAAAGWKGKFASDPLFREKIRITALTNLKKATGLPLTDAQRQARRTNALRLAERRRNGEAAPYNHKIISVEPAGRHCFIGTGYNGQGVQIDTWGLIGTVTWDAVAALTSSGQGGQLYALWSEDSLAKATGKTPAGFDWAQLQIDIDAMRAASRGGIFSWL